MSVTICRVVIRGRVQRVGYRAWTEYTALEIGLEGWVRNRADGTVEALFAGPADVVAAMLDACRQGPPGARVEAIDEREATHRRLSSGAGYGPDGDIRAGNTEAVREQPERLRANAKRGVEYGVRARPPMLGNERSEHLTLTTDARFPILVDEVIQRCQSVVERLDCHSITSSARSSTDCGIVRPSAFAVLRFMTNSNLVGCSTGRSAGFAPFRILST